MKHVRCSPLPLFGIALNFLLIILLLVFSLAVPVSASILLPSVSIKVTQVGTAASFSVSGTVNNITYLSKGFEYRQTQIGHHVFDWNDVAATRAFTATISGTLGVTYEVRAFCQTTRYESSRIYSKTLFVKVYKPPAFTLTTRPETDLVADGGDVLDLCISFVLIIEPNGNTIIKNTMNATGPGFSIVDRLIANTYTYSNSILQIGTYHFYIICYTDSGNYPYSMTYVTRSSVPSPTPSPTLGPTPSPTLGPTPSPTLGPTATPKPTPTPTPAATATPSATTETSAIATSQATSASTTAASTAASSVDSIPTATTTPSTPALSPNPSPTAQPDPSGQTGGVSIPLLIVLGIIAAALVGIMVLLLAKRITKK